MNKVLEIPTELCTPFLGGFYMGRIKINDDIFAIIAANKEEGEHSGIWIEDYKNVPGATSYNDGRANTIAMAEAGSELAQWAIGLHIGGFDDWYIPSQDEQELMYRAAKPTTEENYLYARSGINVSAVPPTYPYTSESPAQTLSAAFQQGGTEAFEPDWYWTSTQHAANSNYAWFQHFHYGNQNNHHKSAELRARAVRRLKI